MHINQTVYASAENAVLVDRARESTVLNSDDVREYKILVDEKLNSPKIFVQWKLLMYLHKS